MIAPAELNKIKDRSAAYAKVLGNPSAEKLKDLSDIGLMGVVDVPRLIAEIETLTPALRGAEGAPLERVVRWQVST